jgi:putative sigma-54 modulation protein
VQIKISTRHGQISDTTKEKISDKVGKLTRYFDRIAAIEVTIDLEHRETPSVEIQVSAKHKHDLLAKAQADELMAAVDVAVDKMEEQLRRYKTKIQSRRGQANRQAGPAGPAPPEPV